MEQIKVGDILVGMWYCTMTYPKFYRVTKVTAKQAKAERLRNKMVRGNGFQGYEVPDESEVFSDKEIVIREGKYGLCTGSGWDYTSLKHWDGEPIWADHMD